ncbi:MAG: hypothetical protein E4H28_08040 [Gemmatimonadales bacterium]|nr:MAG: hypothetical protein E4H28_08040 [Gemmatimonadales bacterium]
MSAGHRLVSTVAACLLIAAVPAQAQTVQVIVPEENFRKEPVASSGNRLATLLMGASVHVAERRGRWIRGSVEGWIWNESVESTDRDGFDLIVIRSEGENLRDQPEGNARRVAVLMRGMLLDRLETRGAWTRVGREAWIWSESTIPVEGQVAQAVNPVDESPAEALRPTPLSDRLVVGSDAAGLLLSPDGDTTAVLKGGTDLTVLAREGGWSRVRLEGWVWEPSTLPPDSVAGDERNIEALRSNPEQFRGRRVEWTVQFVALRQAEALRTDFYDGEPYFLARPPRASRGILYVAVPPELLPAVRELGALQTVEIVARVRTGRSALMGVPILDLIALR